MFVKKIKQQDLKNYFSLCMLITLFTHPIKWYEITKMYYTIINGRM